MSKLFTKKHTKVGARPGTLMIDKDANQPQIRMIRYTADEHFDNGAKTVDEIRDELNKDGVIWIDVQGLGDEKLIRAIGDFFRFICWHWKTSSMFRKGPKLRPSICISCTFPEWCE